MKIGFILHSETGHTLSIAEALQKQLVAKGHSVSIERVTSANDKEPNVNSIVLTGAPDPLPYDLLVFAAPVHGFALSATMQAYLRQIPSLKGKKVLGFVTQAFPSPSMGGKQTIKGMSALIHSKDAELLRTGIVNWMFASRRTKQTAELISSFTDYITSV